MFFPFLLFFFNDTPTTEIYTLSLHDALPIFLQASTRPCTAPTDLSNPSRSLPARDRKSTRLNSSHVAISYAVFCLKKKNKKNQISSVITMQPSMQLLIKNK